MVRASSPKSGAHEGNMAHAGALDSEGRAHDGALLAIVLEAGGDASRRASGGKEAELRRRSLAEERADCLGRTKSLHDCGRR